MSDAVSVRGRPASLDEGVSEAAAILRRSRCAVIAGAGTDVAGAEAAVSLARAVDGVFDHLHADGVLRDLEVMGQAGWIVTTPSQACARADLVLLVGSGLDSAWPGFVARLRLNGPPPLHPDRSRRVIRLCPGEDGFAGEAATIGGEPRELPILLGVLRALCAGRPPRDDAPLLGQLRDCARALQDARYGVALWSAERLDPLAIEMLCGLIDDLNASTRFAGLPVPGPGNAMGIAQASAWASGFPFRTSFARQQPAHDSWRFDARRMVESGEADAAVWIAALDPAAPPWRRALPTIALVARDTSFASSPEVLITVGRPGLDHPAVLFEQDLGGLVAKQAAAASAVPTVAHVVGRIIEALGADPC